MLKRIKENTNVGIVTFLIITVTILFKCSDLPQTNPASSKYEGDYKYSVNWGSLLNDTLEIFKEYQIEFSSFGVDSFASVKITDSLGDVLCDVVNFPYSDSASFISLYFIKAFEGKPILHVIKPNGKDSISICPDSINVLNSYKLKVSSVVGQNCENYAEVTKVYDSLALPEGLKVQWLVGDSAYDSLWTVSNSLNFRSKANDINFVVNLIDKFNNSIRVDSLSIQVEGSAPIIDSVYYANQISQGDTIDLIVSVKDKDKSPFKIVVLLGNDTLSNDTVLYSYPDSTDTSAFSVDVELIKPIIDTAEVELKLFAVDTNNLVSNYKIVNLDVSYLLPTPEFEDSSKVIARGDSVAIPITDVNNQFGTTYYWSIPATGFFDSTTSNSIKVLLTDTVPVKIFVSGKSVYGCTGDTDSMVLIPQNIEYEIKMLQAHDTLSSDSLYTFIATVTDSFGATVSGNVVYYWSIDSNALIDSISTNNDSMFISILNNSNPFYIYLYATINDSNKTPDFAHAVLIDKKPIIEFEADSLSVLLGDSADFNVVASDDGGVDSIFIFNSDTMYSLGTSTTLSLYQTSIKEDTLFAYAIDNEGNVSDTVSAKLSVYTTSPSFTQISDSGDAFIYDTVTITLPNVNPGNNLNSVASYLWDTTGDGVVNLVTTLNSINIVKTESFDNAINAWAVTDFIDTTDVPFQFHLKVKLGAPLVNIFNSSSYSAFINDTLELSVTATDTVNDGTVDSLFVDTTGNSISDLIIPIIKSGSVTIPFDIQFITGGTYNVSVWVKDNHGITSKVVSLVQPIVIDQGMPQIKDFVKPSPIFINDLLTFEIVASDTNGSISEYFWGTEATSLTSLDTNNSFQTVFNTSGTKILFLKVIDDEDNFVIISDTFDVNLGKPVADSIEGKTSVWVNDFEEFTFHFYDVNDTVDTVFINWGDEPGYVAYYAGDSTHITINHMYPIVEDTSYIITLIVKDNDSIMDTCSKVIEVKKGCPIIDSIFIQTDLDSIFVNDSVTYRILAHDLNDMIRTVYVSFDGDNVPEDSVLYLSENADVSYKHAYDTTKSGTNSIRFWVDDSDSIKSLDTVISVNVREGRPLIWGDLEDTLFVIIDNGAPQNYSISPNYFDTNGVIDTFYWNDTPNDFIGAQKTTADSLIRNFSVNDVNKTISKWIAIKDSDGYTASKTFTVLADSVPPVPQLFIEEKIGDSLVIKWESVKDFIDNGETEIKIMIKYGNTGDPDTAIQPYQLFSDYSVEDVAGDDYNTFGFKPPATGQWIKWQIILRDKRGSESKSTIRPYYFN